MATRIRDGKVFRETVDAFDEEKRKREKEHEKAEEGEVKRFFKELKEKYAGQTLYAVFLDPEDERFFRDVFRTYDEALDHIRDDEQRYFYEKDQPALHSLVEAARKKKPTPGNPTLIRPANHDPYGVEAVDGSFLAQRLQWKLDERKREAERDKAPVFSIYDD